MDPHKMLLNTLYLEQYPIFYYACRLHSKIFSQLFYVRIGNTDMEKSWFPIFKVIIHSPFCLWIYIFKYLKSYLVAWLDQTIRIFFKLGLWISLTTYPLGNHQLQFLFVQVNDAYCNVIYRLTVYSHVIELYFTTFLFLLTTWLQYSNMFTFY